MDQAIYSILHVASAMLLVGVTFQAFAAPEAGRRKKIVMASGILSLVMLVAGFGLLTKLGYGFPLWVIIKLVCWLGISAMAGIAFRRPEKVKVLGIVTIVLLLVAIFMVYQQPA
ncbi:MAG: hypothetical protein O3A95_11005 [Planctomycetota bacterium]|nr:hypothetical protein [Planctomycetota bacterium]